MTDTVAGPGVLCDDELVALAHSRQEIWTRPLATVDVSSPRELSAAVARGYRSLLIRGLLSEENPDGAELLLPLALVGVKPGIMASWVTGDLCQVPTAERFELFVNDAGTFVAVTTRPGGVHLFVPVDGRDGLAFFADMARAHQAGLEEGGLPFCILVRGPDQTLAGGFVIRTGRVSRLVPDGDGRLEVAGAAQVQPTSAAWRTEIGALLNGSGTGLEVAEEHVWGTETHGAGAKGPFGADCRT